LGEHLTGRKGDFVEPFFEDILPQKSAAAIGKTLVLKACKRRKKQLFNRYESVTHIHMKKNIIAIGLFLATVYNANAQGVCTKAQGVAELERRNGFKDIHIGDSYSKWAQDLTLDGVTDYGMLAYRLNDGKLWKYGVFDTNVREVILYFSDNSLKQISILTNYFQEPGKNHSAAPKNRMDDISPTLEKLSSLFGPPNSINDGTPDSNELIQYIWLSPKIFLKMCYVNNIENGSYLAIGVYDAPFLLLKEGF